MTEEVTTPATDDVTETVAPEAAPEAAPALSDEQIAEALGVSVDFYQSEVKPNAKNFDKMYSRLNRRAMELSEKEKAPTPAPSTDDDDEGEFEFDAKAAKALRKFVEREFGDIFSLVTETATDAIGEVIQDFSERAKDVDPAKVQEVMDENGWWSRKPSDLRKNLDRAYKLAKAEAVDVEAEAERLAQERFEKLLEEKGLKDDGVVVVKKSPKPSNIDNKDWKDDSLSPNERFELLRAKQSMK